MHPSFEEMLLAIPIVVATIWYFIRLESRLSKIMTDIAWIVKVLDSRRKPRE